MKNDYSKTVRVIIGNSDRNLHLSLSAAMTYFMDIAAEHVHELGIGYSEMKKQNITWITTKTMVDMIRPLSFLKTAELSTWYECVKNGRSYRDYLIKDEDGPLVCAKTEWTAMDITQRRPVAADPYIPGGLEKRDSVCPESFRIIDHDFSSCPVLGKYRVRSTDMDFIGHMNNIAYVKAFLGCLSSEELYAHPIRHFEISYVSQCFENDELEFRIRRCGNESEVCGFNTSRDGKSAVFIFCKTL